LSCHGTALAEMCHPACCPFVQQAPTPCAGCSKGRQDRQTYVRPNHCSLTLPLQVAGRPVPVAPRGPIVKLTPPDKPHPRDRPQHPSHGSSPHVVFTHVKVSIPCRLLGSSPKMKLSLRSITLHSHSVGFMGPVWVGFGRFGRRLGYSPFIVPLPAARKTSLSRPSLRQATCSPQGQGS
jgi:hypothetical protein